MSERGGGLYWEGGRDSCLVLPGLSGAAEAERLAEELHQSGFTVSMPLRGFVRETSDARPPSNWRTWLDEAREEFVRLGRAMDSVAVAGIGLGGTISLILAAEYPVSAVALIAPALKVSGFWGLCSREGIRPRDLLGAIRLARRSLFAVVAPVLIVAPGRGRSAKAVASGVSSREVRIEPVAQFCREFPCEAELPQALAAIKNHLRPGGAQKRL